MKTSFLNAQAFVVIRAMHPKVCFSFLFHLAICSINLSGLDFLEDEVQDEPSAAKRPRNYATDPNTAREWFPWPDRIVNLSFFFDDKSLTWQTDMYIGCTHAPPPLCLFRSTTWPFSLAPHGQRCGLCPDYYPHERAQQISAEDVRYRHNPFSGHTWPSISPK